MNRTIAHRIVPAAILAALMLTVAQPAVAAPVTAYPGCSGFNVGLSATGGNQAVRVTKLKDGIVTTIVAGHGTTLTVTRLDSNNEPTNQAVTFNTPGSVTKQTDNLATGRSLLELKGFNLFLLFPTDPGGPSTMLYTGRAVATVITATFDLIGPVQSSGAQRDICAELGG